MAGLTLATNAPKHLLEIIRRESVGEVEDVEMVLLQHLDHSADQSASNVQYRSGVRLSRYLSGWV